MANEIQADYSSGESLYAVIRNRVGQVWCPAEEGFEDWGADGHTAADYDIALTDKSGGRYIGDFDTNVPPGTYSMQVFCQAGATPADSDTLVAGRDILWAGHAELTVTKILVNKAIQYKVNGAIDVYDDDNETVILTYLPLDGASTSVRLTS